MAYEEMSAGNDQPSGTSGIATASIVISILGFCCPFVGPILGIVLGLVARSQVGRNPRLTGGGMAIGAILIGLVGLLCHAGGTAFAFYAAKQLKVAFEELEKQMKAVEAAAKRGDWDAVASELVGPGSLPKDELVARFKAAEGRYGTIDNLDPAQNTPDEAGFQRDWTAFPMRVVFNGRGSKGDFNMSVDVRRVDNRFQVRTLEFRDGHVADRMKDGGGSRERDWNND